MSKTKLITIVLFAPALLLMSGQLEVPHAFSMSVALVLLPIISYFLGLKASQKLSCRREVQGYAAEGEPIQVSIHTKGNGNLIGPIDIEDILPKWIKKEKGSEIFERTADGFNISYTGIAEKRGEYSLGPMKLRTSDMLGFFGFTVSRKILSNLLVVPRPLHIPGISVQALGEIGDYQLDGVGKKGSGIEFHGVREYQPGDELRRVHWRSTAKHGTLNVIEFEHSESEDLIIAVDTRRGTDLGSGLYSTLEYAVRISAAVAEQTLAMGSSASILWDGVGGPASEPGRGSAQLQHILESLATVKANSENSLTDLLIKNMDAIPAGITLVCIGSSVDKNFREIAELLAFRDIKIQFILITHSGSTIENFDQIVTQLAVSRVSLLVVECSTTQVTGRISYEYTV